MFIYVFLYFPSIIFVNDKRGSSRKYLTKGGVVESI